MLPFCPSSMSMRARRLKSLAAVLLIVVASRSGPTHAADPPADPDLSIEGARRAGPFFLSPFVQLKDVGYDDNIRFDSQEQEGDTTATGGAGLNGLILWGDRGGLRFYGEADYVSFGENTDLNHWNSFARARGIFLLKHVALSLEDRFSSVRDRPNTEIDQRLRRKDNTVTAAVRTLRKGRLVMEGSLRHTNVEYSTDDLGSLTTALRLNRDVESLSLAGDVRILPKTTLTLDGIFEDIDFESDIEGRDSEALSLLAGLRFDPSASLQGHIRLGTKSLEAPDPRYEDTHVTVGDAALSARLGRAARFKGTFARDLIFSTLAGTLYFTDSKWTAGYEHFFSRRVSGEIAYGQGLSKYPNDVTRPPSGSFPAFVGEREDRRTTYSAIVRYRINGQLSLVVGARRLERDSTDDFYDKERNFYTVGSTYNF